MSNAFTGWFTLLVVPLFLLMVSCESSASDETPNRYQSPKAVIVGAAGSGNGSFSFLAASEFPTWDGVVVGKMQNKVQFLG